MRLLSKGKRCLVVIRVRGVSDVSGDISETLKYLALNKPNHATIIDDRPSYLGMLKKVQNHVTWGEISFENLLELIRKWGRLKGDKRLTDEYAQKLNYGSLEELVKAIYECKIDFRSLPDIKPVFRLHPPSKGYKGGVKKSYRAGGSLGYRGEAINELLKRMI